MASPTYVGITNYGGEGNLEHGNYGCLSIPMLRFSCLLSLFYNLFHLLFGV